MRITTAAAATFVVTLVVVASLAVANSAESGQATTGGVNLHSFQVASFAVGRFNELTHSSLALSQVLRQIDIGPPKSAGPGHYDLYIAVLDGGVKVTYETTVHEAEDGSLRLLSFASVPERL